MTSNEVIEYVESLNKLSTKELTSQAIALTMQKQTLESRKVQILCEIDNTISVDKIKKLTKELIKVQEQRNEYNMQVILIKNRISIKVGINNEN